MWSISITDMNVVRYYNGKPVKWGDPSLDKKKTDIRGIVGCLWDDVRREVNVSWCFQTLVD
jgi:hypothetical protein